MSTSLKDLLARALRENGFDLTEAVQEQLLRFLDLLQKWNKVFNLTSLEAPSELVYLHILDSLAILPAITGQRLLDVGSGGGLPGIPLAIVDPSKHWVLLDKSQKKTRFLVQVVAELGLKNVTVACSRCEDFHDAAGFDGIVSRAFATLKLFIESTQHLLKPEGSFLAMKGLYPEQELSEIPATFRTLDVQKLVIHGLPAERHLVRIQRA